MARPRIEADLSKHPSYDPESREFVLDRDGTPDFSLEAVQARLDTERPVTTPAGRQVPRRRTLSGRTPERPA